MADKAGRQADAPISRRSWPVWPLVIFVMLAAVSLLLHLEKASRQKSVLAAREQFAALVRAAPVEEVKAQRGRFYISQYYVGYPIKNSYAAADFVRRLAEAAAPPMKLLKLEINHGLQNFAFKLTAGVVAGGPEPARLLFSGFVESLRNFADISQASFSDPLPATALTPGGQRAMFVISISGQAELQ